MTFTTEDLKQIDLDKLPNPPITYTVIIQLVRDYDLNDIGLAVACLNLGYYLGRNEAGSAAAERPL